MREARVLAPQMIFDGRYSTSVMIILSKATNRFIQPIVGIFEHLVEMPNDIDP